jgi:hypothetical protein
VRSIIVTGKMPPLSLKTASPSIVFFFFWSHTLKWNYAWLQKIEILHTAGRPIEGSAASWCAGFVHAIRTPDWHHAAKHTYQRPLDIGRWPYHLHSGHIEHVTTDDHDPGTELLYQDPKRRWCIRRQRRWAICIQLSTTMSWIGGCWGALSIWVIHDDFVKHAWITLFIVPPFSIAQPTKTVVFILQE